MSASASTHPGTSPADDAPALASFTSLVGATFAARTAHGTIALELIEAKALPAHSAAPRQDPFSLLFQALPDCPLGQGMVRLEHASLGALDVFLVPLAPDVHGRYFEAIFN